MPDERVAHLVQAVIFRSFSDSSRAFFSGPAITRMIPSSSSSWPIVAAAAPRSSAGLADQVREVGAREPGRYCQRAEVDLVGHGLPFECTSRILRRPFRSGRSTTISWSKRPGEAAPGRGCRAGSWPRSG